MNEHQIVDSSFTAIINAPIEKIDIPRGVPAFQNENTRAVHQRTFPQDLRRHRTASACPSTSRSSAVA